MSINDFGSFPLFYKNGSSENSIRTMRCLFEDLTIHTTVSAEYELGFESMVELHNHMNTFSTWKSVSNWVSGVRYTIEHPDGDIFATDTNRGEETSIFKEETARTFKGKMIGGREHCFCVSKVIRTPVDVSHTSCHASKYKWVRIESKKTFRHESERASWDFNIITIWEGETKAIAEKSEKKFVMNISMASYPKASRDPGYTTASFMEKIMDTLFKKSRDRHIVFSE